MSDHTTDVPLKRCSKCHEQYPATAEYFYVDKRRGNRLFARCKLCVNTQTKQWKANNPEKAKAAQNKWRANNPERVKLSRAKWRACNWEKERAYLAKRRAADPEKHKAYLAKWSAENPEKVRGKSERRRNRKRGILSTFTDAEWQRCLEYFDYRCAYCGRPRGLWHALSQDHYIPLSRGGAYTADNIVPACHGEGGCNNHKSNRDAHEWLAGKFGARKARQIERRIREYFEHVAQDKEA